MAPGDAERECAAMKLGDASAVVAANSPLCQPPTGDPASTTQYFSKGDRGTRELLDARPLAARAVPASVCPIDATTVTSPAYRYVPAPSSLTDRLAATLK